MYNSVQAVYSIFIAATSLFLSSLMGRLSVRVAHSTIISAQYFIGNFSMTGFQLLAMTAYMASAFIIIMQHYLANWDNEVISA